MLKCPKCEGVAFPQGASKGCIVDKCGYLAPIDETREMFLKQQKIIQRDLQKEKDSEAKKYAQERKILSELRESAKINPNIRIREYLQWMKNKYETGKGYNIYVAELNPSIAVLDKKVKRRTFSETPDFVENKNPIGYVYVGLTSNSREHRFDQHLDDYKAGRGYVRDFHISKKYEECVGRLSNLYGFDNVSKKNSDYLESWVAWSLYQAGYWVWGSHKHKEEDFLETGDYI